MKYVVATVLLAHVVFGCADPLAVGSGQSSADMIGQRDRQIARLQRGLTEAQDELADQQRQINTLQALGPQRLDHIFHVDRIRLGRFTGGYDIDGAPGHDGVKVYLEPIDAAGSVLKAAGDVTIQLFDLAAGDGKLELATYRFAVDDITTHWFDGALTYHYSFVCPWGSRPPTAAEVTVRITFVDYLTGKTFTAQKRCRVQLATATQPAVSRTDAAGAAAPGR